MTNREIKDLMRFFDKSGITKVKIKNEDFSIELQKGFDASSVCSSPSSVGVQYSEPTEKQEKQSTTNDKKDAIGNGLVLKSPMVGTFYVAPSPGSASFVDVGSSVKKGQTIAIIEAMKIMNEIEAEFDCKITSILAEDGEPVEFDMPLFGVEKL